MELTEDEIIEKYVNIVAIVIEILYYHAKINGLVLVVVIT